MNVITLPNGKRVSLGVYVNAWRALKNMRASQDVKGWDHFPVPASRVLRDMRDGMQDRINIRGRLEVRDVSEKRTFTLWQNAVKRGAIKIECRSCGSPITHYVNPNNTNTRYCPGCR